MKFYTLNISILLAFYSIQCARPLLMSKESRQYYLRICKQETFAQAWKAALLNGSIPNKRILLINYIRNHNIDINEKSQYTKTLAIVV